MQRMEADSVLVEVRPIIVTDVLGPLSAPARPGPADAATAHYLTVQSFLNNVVMVTTHGQVGAPLCFSMFLFASFVDALPHTSPSHRPLIDHDGIPQSSPS
jgi:hypothetical protein